jgi:hypothetical protein
VFTRYLLTPPTDTRPSLVVDLVDQVDATSIAATRETMFRVGCAHGLVLDAARCVVLRDTFASMEESSIEAEADEVATPKLLLGQGNGPLADQVERWLRSLARNWHTTLPKELWVAALLSDVVPAAAGAVVQRLEAA